MQYIKFILNSGKLKLNEKSAICDCKDLKNTKKKEKAAILHSSVTCLQKKSETSEKFRAFNSSILITELHTLTVFSQFDKGEGRSLQATHKAATISSSKSGRTSSPLF